MADFDLMLEAFSYLNRSDKQNKNIAESQISNEKVLIHFTDTFEKLKSIISSEKFTAGSNYDGVSFTQGIDDVTHIPLQIKRKDKWSLGIEIEIDKYSELVKPYHDAKRLLTDRGINRSDLFKICGIARMSNGEHWLAVTSRELPVFISKDFFDYLKKNLKRFQSDKFLSTHTNTYTNDSKFEKSLKAYYRGSDVTITDLEQYRTRKSNSGIYITSDSEYVLSSDRNFTLSNYIKKNR